ncbi:MAG: hypothetical protein ABWY00_15795 [Dongiaceae bacterium]
MAGSRNDSITALAGYLLRLRNYCGIVFLTNSPIIALQKCDKIKKRFAEIASVRDGIACISAFGMMQEKSEFHFRTFAVRLHASYPQDIMGFHPFGHMTAIMTG